MRKSFLAAITIATIMASCTTSTDEMTGIESLTTDAASTITTYISNNYPDTKLVTSVKSGGNVSVILNTGEELTFSTSGTFLAYSNNAGDGVLADSLGIPCDSTRIDSIRAGHNHGGKGGKHGDKGGKHGGKGGKHGNDSTFDGGKHGHDRHFRNEIAIDSLSADINTYVSTNYSGYTVLHAESDTICEGAVTEVLVAIGGAQPLKLVFDASNVYLMKAERFAYADVPAEVSTAVTTNFSTYSVMKKCEKQTLPDGSIKYVVHFRSTDAHKVATFNADGSVSCEN